MNCLTAQHDLDDLRAGRLDTDRAEETRAHLETCPHCRAYAEDIASLKSRMEAAPMPPAPSDLLLGVREASRLPLRLALAAAVAFLVLGGSLVLLPRFHWEETVTAPVPAPTPLAPMAPAHPVQIARTVVLAVVATQDLAGVKLRLVLPPGAEVEGRPGETRFEWDDDLLVGTNRLRLPLLLAPDVEGSLEARVEHQGRSREFRVSLAEPDEGELEPNRG